MRLDPTRYWMRTKEVGGRLRPLVADWIQASRRAIPPLLASAERRARQGARLVGVQALHLARHPRTRLIARRVRAAAARLPRPSFSALFLSGGGASLLCAAYILYCLFTLPVHGGIGANPAPSALLLQASDGDVFATRGSIKGAPLHADNLPPLLVKAITSIEDRRFFEHGAIDLHGMLRAIFHDIFEAGRAQGASTITQQLARIAYLSPERTLRRKVQEALIALWLEHNLSKQQILARYLNTAYFGAGAYGVDAAARRYFGKDASDLTLSEAAMLAGLVRAPSQLSPERNERGAVARAALVLGAMQQTGAITPLQAARAKAHPAKLKIPPETPPGFGYFADSVAGDVRALIGVGPTDLTVQTTMNENLQRLADRVVKTQLDHEGVRKHASQAALVAMSMDGAILAMVGGRDYQSSQFNRATQAARQPGSLFKLFVYLTALERGMGPRSIIVDRPVQIGDWRPKNFERRFSGPVTLRTAFAKSINTVAVQLAEKVGIPAVIRTARKLGVDSPLPVVPSIALGSAEVTLLEMTRAYGAVAAHRAKLDSYTVRSIVKGDQSLYTRPVLYSQEAEAAGPARAGMLDLLSAAVREGTAKAARLSIPVAGKTGTTQDFRDAWFIGFTPDLIVGVWVGNDDNSPMKGVTGGDIPARIFHDFVGNAESVLARRRAGIAAPEAAAGNGPSSVLRGVPKAIDTATLSLDGKTIRLLGLVGERGIYAEELARFLRHSDATCRPAPKLDAYRCSIRGFDLSEIVAANGGARADSSAPVDVLAMQDLARRARRGIWRRSR